VKTEPTKPLLGFSVKLAACAGAEPTPDSTPASATTSATAEERRIARDLPTRELSAAGGG
jgi:hypothetical protein